MPHVYGNMGHCYFRMKNNSLKKQIIQFIVENYEDEILLADGFETAFLGIGYREDAPCAVYDTGKCLKSLMEDGMSWEEATEYFQYNVEGACIGKQTPIFIDSFRSV